MIVSLRNLLTIVVSSVGGDLPGNTAMSEKLLTRSEVSDMLSISLRSVDRLRARGILPAVKVLSTVRFRAEDVKKLIDPQQRDPDRLSC